MLKLKKFALIGLSVVVLSACAGEAAKDTEVSSTPPADEQSSVVEESSSVEVESEESAAVESSSGEQIKEVPTREDSVGKSDGDISEFGKLNVMKARNDVTGNWRVVTTGKNIDLEKYGKSYAETYMNDSEVHIVENLLNKTSTILNKTAGVLSVDIHEYVDKEEHDAKKMGTGMLLKTSIIYLDNGDIVELEIEE